MGHDKVRSEGRVRYVEPNDFLEESLYGNNGSFNTTHPYEDYSMHVDLIVKVPDRHGKAENNDGTIIELGTFNAEKINTAIKHIDAINNPFKIIICYPLYI